MSLKKDLSFKPDFKKAGGLIPVIAQCAESKDVLMLAYMNEEAFNKTMESSEAWYWSRSRQELWHKGATSGHIQKVKSIRLDCDNDAIVLLIEQIGGAACHTGAKSCFYKEWKDGKVSVCAEKIFEPNEVYK